VHTSPHKPKPCYYVTSKSGVEHNFKSFEARICFVEYTHKSVIFKQTPDGEVKDYVSDTWNIKKENRYINNFGCLGQPQDVNPDASFIVYDFEEKTLGVHCFEYDLSSTQHKIRENSLHLDSVERLAQGR
jgi:hypothetical protein